MNSMKALITGATLLLVGFNSAPASANTCKAKRLKVTRVCGLVVDSSGTPAQGASLQLLTEKGAPLTLKASTLSDGRFSLDNTPEGDFSLAITAAQHGSGTWPLHVTRKAKAGQCKKPLVVHLQACDHCACSGWVGYK
jgi:hypothetical protein